VSQKERAEARDQIDVAVAVGVDDVGSPRGGVDDGRQIVAAFALARLAAGVDGRGLERGEPPSQLAREAPGVERASRAAPAR
jgi:hypothetical protein